MFMKVIREERPDYIVINLEGNLFYEVIDNYLNRGKLIPKSIGNERDVVEHLQALTFAEAEQRNKTQGVPSDLKLGMLVRSLDVEDRGYDCYGRLFDPDSDTSPAGKYCYIYVTPIGRDRFTIFVRWPEYLLVKDFLTWEDALSQYDGLTNGPKSGSITKQYLRRLGFDEI